VTVLGLTVGVLLAQGGAASPSALEQVGLALAQVVVKKNFGAPVGVYVEGAAGAALPRALASVLSADLSAAALDPVAIEAKDAAGAERAARALGVVSLVRLTVSLENQQLVARGDAVVTRANFWSGDLPVRGSVAAVLTATADADAEVLVMHGTVPPNPAAAVPLELRVSSVLKSPSVPAALGLGDLDGDKKAELVALVQDRLLVFTAEGKLLAKAELSAPLSTRPTREPFGLIAVAPGKITVWSGRRERAEAFSFSRGVLKSAGLTDVVLLDGVGLKVEPSFNRAQSEVSWAAKPVALPLGPQTVSLVGPLGFFTFADGSASLTRGVAPVGHVLGVGSASVVADLEGAGVGEVIVTGAKTFGEVDEVRVLSVTAFEALQARGALVAEGAALWQQPLKGRAVVAAAGDLDGDGADEVVLGVWAADGSGELLVLKRVAP
jgi:hypothetical protein